MMFNLSPDTFPTLGSQCPTCLQPLQQVAISITHMRTADLMPASEAVLLRVLAAHGLMYTLESMP